MKRLLPMRSIASLLVIICLLATPVAALGKKGDKHFKLGLQYEAAQQWERAAQEFTLAVAADPSNLEYQLHYRRCVFNASQMFMQQGRALAEKRDYVGAYNAFRQAYAYDPVNQLALSEMERMLRLQNLKDGPNGDRPPAMDNGPGVSVTPSSYQQRGGETDGTASAPPAARAGQPEASLAPYPTQQLRIVSYNSVDLKTVIRSLAEQLGLNVIFDRQSFSQPRTIDINLHDVTTAQALDWIFLQEGLFFQKLSRRTILVADQTRRPQYQQLVIRTFYLSNIAPEDATNLITRVIPPSAGRPQTIVIPDKATNSVTVRDTAENVGLIGELIKSIDKDRAEVVMDVNIYEVSRTDLLQLGNQIGTDSTLTNIGFSSGGIVNRAGLGRFLANPTAVGVGLALPVGQIAALQKKNRTRLVASTQVHAFNGEESSARIGQRVPVQTAQTYPFGFQSGQSTTTTPGGSFSFPGGGFPVINYEPTGLTFKFTPQVFPNLDVQVKMSIESKDVFGGLTTTPTFTERTITGTARIQNNRTMMLASLAQDRLSNGRTGLPLVGLVPLLGRLFTAPTRDNDQLDLVIAVTPRVLRAPAITPRDEEPRQSGTLQMPTSGSLEAMLQETYREEQLAAARRVPNNVSVQLPDAEMPAYVPAPKALMTSGANNMGETASGTTANAAQTIPVNIQATKGDTPPPVMPASAASTSATANKTSSAGSESSGALALMLKNMMSGDEPPAYAPATKLLSLPAGASAQAGNEAAHASMRTAEKSVALPAPIDVGAALKTFIAQPTGAVAEKGGEATGVKPAPQLGVSVPVAEASTGGAASTSTAAAELRFVPEQQKMRVGEKQRLALVLGTGVPLNLTAVMLRFDPRVMAVRGVSPGNMFAGAQGASPVITLSAGPEGLLISVSPMAGVSQPAGTGVLVIVEIEAVGVGESTIGFGSSSTRVVASDGRNAQLQLAQGRVVVKK